jgi:hypothetical protein
LFVLSCELPPLAVRASIVSRDDGGAKAPQTGWPVDREHRKLAEAGGMVVLAP